MKRGDFSRGRRRYIRISTVLPVEFYVSSQDGKQITPWLQGFTRDIGKGGICLVLNDLWWGFWDRFSQHDTLLHIKVDLPIKKGALIAQAKVVWARQQRLDEFTQYTVGLELVGVEGKKAQRLFGYAFAKKAFPIVISGVLICLAFVSGFLTWRTFELVRENRKLVSDYVTIIEKRSDLEEGLGEERRVRARLKRRQVELQRKMTTLEMEARQWRSTYESFVSQRNDAQAQLLKDELGLLEKELAGLQRENKFLKAKEKEREAAATVIKEEVKVLKEEQQIFSRKVIEGLYQWIGDRQDLKRGLVLSFEGDRDLKKGCFTYDQALAAIVFLIKEDREKAERILDFYLQQVEAGKPIYNAYSSAGTVFEYVQHCGPNAWIGLAALNYQRITGSKKYLSLARAVAVFLQSMMDSEGGIKGGPDVSWYSTEHHLDAFAFFDLFYQLTKKPRYASDAARIKEWIAKYAYTDYGPPVRRGKGDATIATDTYAWSITAFGPQVLRSLKMSPEAILEFAIQNCEVNVSFQRRDREVNVTGFDFAKFRNMARGGVVSCEWTAQMILALEIIANDYQPATEIRSQYFAQAQKYFNELQKMMITSPSKAGREAPCLPYASAESADTGHGWRTPRGDRTGSLAATAYCLIAYYGYNPLKAQSLEVALQDLYENENHAAYAAGGQE